MVIDSENLYQRAIDVFGKEVQMDMCEEELAELILALKKFKRDKTLSKHKSIDNLLEEIADVEIMLRQLKILLPRCYYLFNVEMGIEENKTYKLERLKERLDKHCQKSPNNKQKI